jgi:phosphoinositide-3-kinase, regulatory subunit 4
MGQGYSLTTLPAGSAGIDVPEMSDLTYEKSLGNARFMKCIRARHKDGLVIAKVVMKPYSAMELDKYIKVLLGTAPKHGLNYVLMSYRGKKGAV